MNENIINEVSTLLGVKNDQVISVLKLLEDGNTIPFIARYRKERTGALDEEQIRSINTVYEYQVNLLKRKEDVIRLIDEKGLLTDEIKNNVMNAKKLVEVEDIYLPFKEKKKTKATEAIKNGLEPLAKIIMSFPTSFNIESVDKYLNEIFNNISDEIYKINKRVKLYFNCGVYRINKSNSFKSVNEVIEYALDAINDTYMLESNKNNINSLHFTNNLIQY